MHVSKALAKNAYAGDASIVARIYVRYKRCCYVYIGVADT